MSKLNVQGVLPTKSPKSEREGTGKAKKTPVALPKQLLSATRIVQLLPERTRIRKGSFTHSEPKKSDPVEKSASPKKETPKTLPIPDLTTPIIATKDEVVAKSEETPTTIFEGRPKRNTPKLRRFIDDFFFLIKPPTMHSKPPPPPLKPILNENGIPIKRGRGRPSNRERLEAQLLASQRVEIQSSGDTNNRPADINQECLEDSTKVIQNLVDPVHGSGTASIPREEAVVLQKPKPDEEAEQCNSPLPDSRDKEHQSPHSQKQTKKTKPSRQPIKSTKKYKSRGSPKSGNDSLNMEKENVCEQQPPKRKRGRPRKHPLPETPNVPGERSRSLPALPRTPSSKQKGGNGKNLFKRKSLPQHSIPKHRKPVTIADLITESESTDKSDQEGSVITSGDEQADTTFRASNVRISPTCKAYHSVLNPLPGFIDAITCTEVVRPAISPYGHVLSWETCDQGPVLWGSQECLSLHQEASHQASIGTT